MKAEQFAKWLDETFDQVEQGAEPAVVLAEVERHALRLGAGDIVPAGSDKRSTLVYLGKLIAWCRAQPSLLWDAERAAAELGISKRTLWELTNSGEIPYKRLGRQLRYPAAALHKWSLDVCA